jgi:hypothetical protein
MFEKYVLNMFCVEDEVAPQQGYSLNVLLTYLLTFPKLGLFSVSGEIFTFPKIPKWLLYNFCPILVKNWHVYLGLYLVVDWVVDIGRVEQIFPSRQLV